MALAFRLFVICSKSAGDGLRSRPVCLKYTATVVGKPDRSDRHRSNLPNA